MEENLNIEDVGNAWSSLIPRVQEQIWNPDTFIQILVIGMACVVGALAYRVLKPRIQAGIDKAELPIRIKRIIHNLQRLVFHLIMLIVLFLCSQIMASEFLDIGTFLNITVMKLLLAWIVIRISVQFINNTLVRNIFAFSIGGIAALSIFGILDETSTTLDAIGFGVGSFRFSALTIIKGMLSIFILLYLAMFASTFLERRVLKSKSLTRSSQVLIAKIIRIALITFAVLIGVTSAGIDLSIFTVFSGAVGLGIGFGLQRVVSNLFSGLLLLMDQSIKPGDVIELEQSGTFGWVNQMAARYTEIVTRDNKSYLIPNEEFITQRVVNWSHGDRLIRIEVLFGTHYDSNPHDVIRIAKRAATRPERVVSDKEPVCWITDFGDSSVNYTLRFWIKDAEGGISNVKGEVLLSLWDALKDNNIEIPYPQRVVHMAPAASPDTAQPKMEPPEKPEEAAVEETPPSVKNQT